VIAPSPLRERVRARGYADLDPTSRGRRGARNGAIRIGLIDEEPLVELSERAHRQ
jgi:hypothetical protein